MPKYKSHLAGGILTFILVVFLMQVFLTKRVAGIPIQRAVLYLLFCLLGSLFPDIDTKSKAQKIIYFPLFFLVIISIILKNWMLLSTLSLITLIPILVNHRSLTHKIWFVVAIPLIPLLLTLHFNKNNDPIVFNFYFFFVAGAISHIFLDFGPKRFFRRF